MVKPSRETEIIDRLNRLVRPLPADVIVGIGDDAAVTVVPSGMQLITATDSLAEGTHFLPDAPAASVGHRSLACNLSDMAAMGATPRWANLMLSLPVASSDWIDDFAAGFFALSEQAGVVLTGGDTIRGPLVVGVTLQGLVPAGTAVRRSGAAIGDDVYVSGAPGEAAAGRLLLTGELQSTDAVVPYLHRRFLFPEPRIAAGIALRDVASAMIDVSDGVYTDLGRLLSASGAAAEVIVPDFGDKDALARVVDISAARHLWLHGGEDLELCFTAPRAARQRVDNVFQSLGLPLRRFGEVRPGAGVCWICEGKTWTNDAGGFEHFQAE